MENNREEHQVVEVPDNDIQDEEDLELEDSESEYSTSQKPWDHFRWLQRDTSVILNLAGTDWTPRIVIETMPSGRKFHHKISMKREEKSGRILPDQKLLYLLNSKNRAILSLDYTRDLKSFHVMEPGSQRFIAFFTLPCYPREKDCPKEIHIHNVIDDEIYIVDSLGPTDLTFPIKSANGEEMAVIMRPPPKWTATQPGLMTIHFTGDDREGLTCRERAILLGFFLAIGVQGVSHWKRSSVGLLTVYLLSALLGCFLVLIVYIAFRNDHYYAENLAQHKLSSGKFLPSG